MSELDYRIVDVFTDRPFAGNPLAVVLGADDLGTEQCQALAREFNLSETSFPMGGQRPGADYRLRIFTPQRELPFAGHPSVGAAWVMAQLGRVQPGRVVQDCGAGLLPLDLSPGGAVTLTGGAPRLGPELDPAPLLAAGGLQPSDLADGPPARTAGTGLDFPYLPVVPDAVARARAGGDVVVFAVERPASSGEPLRVHARVFVAGAGVAEDPATGSAALGLGVWLVASGVAAPDGQTAYVVHQGAEMHRPSRLACVVTASGGTATSARVTGRVVPVASGRIVVPA